MIVKAMIAALEDIKKEQEGLITKKDSRDCNYWVVGVSRLATKEVRRLNREVLQ